MSNGPGRSERDAPADGILLAEGTRRQRLVDDAHPRGRAIVGDREVTACSHGQGERREVSWRYEVVADEPRLLRIRLLQVFRAARRRRRRRSPRHRPAVGNSAHPFDAKGTATDRRERAPGGQRHGLHAVLQCEVLTQLLASIGPTRRGVRRVERRPRKPHALRRRRLDAELQLGDGLPKGDRPTRAAPCRGPPARESTTRDRWIGRRESSLPRSPATPGAC